MQVEEVEDGRVLQAFLLQLGVGAHVGRDEGGRRHAKHVLGEALFIHQLGAGNAHQLDADAHEAHVVDVGRDVRAGAGETHPGRVAARLGVNAVAQRWWQAVMHDELGAHHALRLGVAAALETAGLPQAAHLLLETRNDGVNERFFARQQLFFGDLQPFVGTLGVDQGRGQAREGLAQHRVKGRAQERVEAALQLDEGEQGVGQPVQHGRAGVGGRHRAAGVGIHGDPPWAALAR